jgi:hypothetical protein
MTLVVVNGPVIEAGASLSNGVDCTAGKIVRITTPADWDSANLTFMISSDGAGFNDLYTADGTEVTIVVKGDNSAILVDEKWTHAVGWLKVRSGTSKYPVAQKERREFAIALEVDAASAMASASRAEAYARYGAHAGEGAGPRAKL